MKKNINNILVVTVIALTLCINTSQVFAATVAKSVMTEEERLSQIVALLQVVAALQKELQIVLAEEKKEAALAINDGDYLRGPDSAEVKILTYIDFESPFSKLFHETLTQVVTENEGVAVVYRHFPLEQLFPNAKTVAIGAECVGLLGREDAFWNFSDSVFDSRGTNEQTNISRLTEFAEDAGIPKSTFESCR